MNSWAALLDALCAGHEKADPAARLRAARCITPMLDSLWLASRGLRAPAAGGVVAPAPAQTLPDGPPSAPMHGDSSEPPNGGNANAPFRDAEVDAAGNVTAATASSGLPDQETRSSQVYVQVHDGGESLPGARRMHIAGAPALGRQLQLERAFATLRTRRATPRGDIELDVDRTVEQFAATGRVRAVWRPRRGRWLDLAVIVERSPTMRFWQATADHFVPVADRGLGALRTRVLFLQHDTAGLSLCDRRGRARALDLPGKDSMVLCLTDTLGSGWASGNIPTRLAQWARQRPVVVVHVLPGRFWPRTPLTAELPLTTWQGRNAGVLQVQIPPVPLLSYLDVASLRRVARALCGRSRQGALRLCRREEDREPWPHEIGARFRGDDADASENDADVTPVPFSVQEIDDLWDDFQASAASSTRRLAVYLAAAPLVMPVMRLIERTFIPEAAPWQIAELAMSGLIRRWPGSVNDDIERIEYEFLPGIRERLLQDAGELRRRQVIRELTRYVEQRFGRAREFAVYTGIGQWREGASVVPSEQLDAGFEPFLRSAEIVSRLFPYSRDGASAEPPIPIAAWEEAVRMRVYEAPIAGPLCIANMIAQAMHHTQARAAGQGVVLHAQIGDGIFDKARGDADMLQLMLVDLIRHALTYTRDGQIVIRAERLHPSAPSQSHQDLKLTIEDTGAADPNWLRARLDGTYLSSRDIRVHGTMENIAEVPIAYCRGILSAMQGSLGVTSNADKMTRVWLRFPLQADVASGDDDPVPPPPDFRYARPMLVVSTDPARSHTIVSALRGEGMDVEREASLHGLLLHLTSFFQQSPRERYDTVLIDLHGVDVASLCRDIDGMSRGAGLDGFGTKFLALADSLSLDDQQRLKQCGFGAPLRSGLQQQRIIDYVKKSRRVGITSLIDEPFDDPRLSTISPPRVLLVGLASSEAVDIVAALRPIAASTTNADADVHAIEKLFEASFNLILVDFDACGQAIRTLLRLWRLAGVRRREPRPVVIGVSPECDGYDGEVDAWLPAQAEDHDIQRVVLDELVRCAARPRLLPSQEVGRARALYMADRSTLTRIGENVLKASGYDVTVADASTIARRAKSDIFDIALVDVDSSPRNVEVRFLRDALEQGGNYCPIVAVVDPGRAKIEHAPERGFDEVISCYVKADELVQLRRWLWSIADASQRSEDRAGAAAAVLKELAALDLAVGGSICWKVRMLVRWDAPAMNDAFVTHVRGRLRTLRAKMSPDNAAASARELGAMCRVMQLGELARLAKVIENVAPLGNAIRQTAEFEREFDAVFPVSGS